MLKGAKEFQASKINRLEYTIEQLRELVERKNTQIQSKDQEILNLKKIIEDERVGKRK